MARKRKQTPIVGRTSIEVLSWVMENWYAIKAHVEDRGSIADYQFPSETARSVVIWVLHDEQKHLGEVLKMKNSAEAKLAAKKPKGMADDARKQFDILRRLAQAIPARLPPPGPDMGIDPEIFDPTAGA
jgi:hypothetical protein